MRYVSVGSGGRPETSKSNCLRWTSKLGDVKMSQLSRMLNVNNGKIHCDIVMSDVVI